MKLCFILLLLLAFFVAETVGDASKDVVTGVNDAVKLVLSVLKALVEAVATLLGDLGMVIGLSRASLEHDILLIAEAINEKLATHPAFAPLGNQLLEVLDSVWKVITSYS